MKPRKMRAARQIPGIGAGSGATHAEDNVSCRGGSWESISILVPAGCVAEAQNIAVGKSRLTFALIGVDVIHGSGRFFRFPRRRSTWTRPWWRGRARRRHRGLCVRHTLDLRPMVDIARDRVGRCRGFGRRSVLGAMHGGGRVRDSRENRCSIPAPSSLAQNIIRLRGAEAGRDYNTV